MSMKYKQIRGIIRCESGLRVGAGREELVIGGVDNPIVRDPSTGEPYIPGSSIKGRMRSLIERDAGKLTGKAPHGCTDLKCTICRVFGPHGKTKHEFGPSRLIVRDAYLCPDDAARFRGGEPVVETRTESSNDRQSTTAYNPRPVERVAHGVRFELALTVRVLEGDNEAEIDAMIQKGLQFLQYDGIGGGITRGHGQVTISITEPAGWTLT